MKKTHLRQAISLIKMHHHLVKEFVERSDKNSKNKAIIKHIDTDIKDMKSCEIAIKCMEFELQRLENNPLTLKQLETMINKPVWDNYMKNWKILSFVNSEPIDSEIYLEFDDGISYYFATDRFYKYGPKE